MTTYADNGITWRKSSASPTNGSCVEAGLADNGVPLLSDSKLRTNRPILTADLESFNSLLHMVRNGQLNP